MATKRAQSPRRSWPAESNATSQMLQAAAGRVAASAAKAFRQTVPSGGVVSPSATAKVAARVKRHVSQANTTSLPAVDAGDASSFIFAETSSSHFDPDREPLADESKPSRRLTSETTQAVQAIVAEILEASEDENSPNAGRQLLNSVGDDHSPSSRASAAESLTDFLSRDRQMDAWLASDDEDSTSLPGFPASRAADAAFSEQSTAKDETAKPEVEPAEAEISRQGRISSREVQRALREAQSLASQEKFAEAVKACLSTLDGPQLVVQSIQILCETWRESQMEQVKVHQESLESLMSELTTARERDTPDVWRLVEEIQERETELSEQVRKREKAQRKVLQQEGDLRSVLGELEATKQAAGTLKFEREAAQQRAEQWRKLKEDKDRELLDQKRKCESIEREASFLRRSAWLADRTAKENAELKRQLQQAEAKSNSHMGVDAMVQKIAALECSPLQHIKSEARAAARKKLLMKWHPDKQPSPVHVEFATRVMQAMQNQPEWQLE